MGSANQAMWKTFGIKAGRKCETKNYVLNPVNGEKIYFLADGPHLLKNIKQCLVQNKIIQLPNDFVEKYKLTSDLVDVQHIKDFCEEEGKFELQFASKLNVDLLQSNHFNKMKVSNSLNVLNRNVSCGIKFDAEEEREDKSSLTTAVFIDVVHRWFQLISSRSTILALSKFNMAVYRETIEFLQEFIKLCS
ncbi:hypothetical protein Zmor_027721 [Zophobas morio]|uniref:Transposable element P transposase n=1 Tax=Zophobas morio TaxID=2755281 RepID=A0AA38HPF0_9CUCU|nr:hypothetical protein Zmor_027721 [Zophobas morio]